MPHPKVKIADNDGNTVAVDTSSNALHVKLAESIDVGMLGDVNIQLADTAVSANDGDADAGTIRVTLANDDTLGGVIYTDDDDWSSSSKHILVGGLYSDSNIVTSGDVAPFRIDLQGAMVIDVANGGVLETMVDDIETKLGAIQTATELSDNVVFLTDNQFSNPSFGNLILAVRNDSLDSLVNVTNDMAPLQVNASGALYVEVASSVGIDHAITGGADGVTVVSTAGTHVELASSTVCNKVDIQAQTDNTGLIAVGFDAVDATEATGTGVILYAGDTYSLEINNLNLIYIDSTVSGEGVRYTYFT